MKDDCCWVQERQRQGIRGIHMESLKEKLDQQELQKLLGLVLHHTGLHPERPAPDLQALTNVILSRCVFACVYNVTSVVGQIAGPGIKGRARGSGRYFVHKTYVP